MPDSRRQGDRSGHVIVCGMHALGLRVVEVLRSSEVDVVVVDDDPDVKLLPILERWGVPFIHELPRLPEVLNSAGLDGARAVVSVEADDLQNLETALVVRSIRPDVRIILQMANSAVGAAVSKLVSSGAALDVASLAAPSLVQACLGGSQILHLEVEGVTFALTETVVTRPGSLRSIYEDLVPIAVVSPDTPIQVCPGRDQMVKPGDKVSVLGTAAELDEALGSHRAAVAPQVEPSRRAQLAHAVRSVAQGAGQRLGLLILAIFALFVTSTVILRFSFREGHGHLSVLNSAYFTVETISTVGYGDYSFAQQATWLRVFAIILIILGATSITALFALITDLLLSRRVVEAFGRGRVTRMRGHVVVVGLGAVGLRVVEELIRYRLQVVVIEHDEQNRHLQHARALDVPVLVGDATRAATLDSANVGAASAVAILTSDDLTNLETGLSLRDYLSRAGQDIPIVMRIFDRPLGRVIEESFGFHLVRSTSALAAPWFVGAALGLDILSTFYVEQELFLVARLTVAPAGGLAGLAMQDLSARIRVIAIHRAGADVLEHPPRRATRFGAGDRAYLLGPYDELLGVLERDASRAGTDAAGPEPGPTSGEGTGRQAGEQLTRPG